MNRTIEKITTLFKSKQLHENLGNTRQQSSYGTLEVTLLSPGLDQLK